jgi:hypothetical protein
MSAEPCGAATWPSLYYSLCGVIRSDGFVQAAPSSDCEVFAILVSQLKPKLQKYWHIEFDESSLSYFNEQGKLVRVKKMKHLLLGLLEWHRQRCLCPHSKRHSQVNEALAPTLELTPSKTHHDLMLRCTYQCNISEPDFEECYESAIANDGSASLLCDGDAIPCHIDEVAKLEQNTSNEETDNINVLEQITNVWDNPSEPPPFEYCGNTEMPTASRPHEHVQSYEMAVPTDCKSRAMVPTVWVWDGQRGHILPAWCMIGDHDTHRQGNIAVQQAVTTFENHKGIPSFFTMGSREFWQ